MGQGIGFLILGLIFWAKSYRRQNPNTRGGKVAPRYKTLASHTS